MTTTLTETDGSAATEAADKAAGMHVIKRDGSREAVDVNKIVRRVQRSAEGLDAVDPMRVATRTISVLADGATTIELDETAIRTAAGLVVEEPDYSLLAARLLSTFIAEETAAEGVDSFTDSISIGNELGVINDRVATFVAEHAEAFNGAIDHGRDDNFKYFGLRTVYDRYLLRHPQDRWVIERPQHFLLRVACGLSDEPGEAIEFYRLLSSLRYLPSSPTLFNSGTTHEQMSSCYLLDSPADDLAAIYDRYKDVAQLSKHAGGIGLSYSRIRSRGSLIKGTNGLSNGIVPFLKTLDSSVAAVNQGGRRKGAACVYLETWHADIEDFLELRDNTGDESRRTHHLNLAHWVPDLFMHRVEQDWQWSLFDPKKVPELVDLWGEDFEAAYRKAENEELYEKQIPARQLYARIMRTLAQTGNGWMTFKDTANRKANQTASADNVIHLSNLCTEILEVTSQDETAVCNLGSIALARLVHDGERPSEDGVAPRTDRSFDFDELGEITQHAVTYLDRVIDRNFYPTDEAAASNARWRPVGLGIMGLQDVFFQLGLPFDSEEARELSARISEEVYFHALNRSCELAERHGAHEAFDETRAARGQLQYDLWEGAEPTEPARWEALKERIAEHGLRNSLLIAIAPTATISSIAGVYECIEPQVANVFKRETLSGEFMQVNTYLVRDLQARGLWTENVRRQLKRDNGSVQGIEEIPAELRELYRTAWEIPQKALIDMQAARGPWIDQSASLNLFMETPTIGKLSSMYAYAWNQGLKTTYYLRSRPATRINQATTDDAPSEQATPTAISDGDRARSNGDHPHSTNGERPGHTHDGGQRDEDPLDSDAEICTVDNNYETCEACD